MIHQYYTIVKNFLWNIKDLIMEEMKIVKDEQYQNMYRIQWPDGTLSEDMYNYTRAKDYIQRLSVQELKPWESTVIR